MTSSDSGNTFPPPSRRKRTKKEKALLAAKDTFHVLDPCGVEITLTGYGPKVGLLLAQERAQRDYTKPVTLTVERRTLFGPPVTLYQVVRDEHGQVVSFTIAELD